MSVQDNVFFKAMAIVLGALVLFTLSIMFLANVLSPPGLMDSDPLVQTQLMDRIRPVGMSRLEP